jgi:hypothetical protein
LVARRLVTVRTSSATLVTTPEHPFAKVGAGWTRAADLARGDRVQTAGGGEATVVGVEIREVQPTAVHNLTVNETRAYFVGPQALLVHNTDCGSPSSPRQSRVRQREGDPHELREQFRARRAQRKALLADKRRRREREREQRRMTQHPFNDMADLPNCAYCVLAGLTDADTVSTLILQKNLHPSDARLSVSELLRLMKEWDLKNEDTPRSRQFPGSSAEQSEASVKVERDLQNGEPHPTFPFHEHAKTFMETSSANTFVVALRYWDGSRTEQHALLAVRRDDGSIRYLELQRVPPVVYDDIDPRSHGALVIPTNVDWRANWQLSYVIENGVYERLWSVQAPTRTTPRTLDLFR